MYAILYQSLHSNKVALAEIGKVAEIANAKFGITGCLLKTNKYFFQYIEGPVDPIHQLMANIARDPRHFDVQILHQVYISSRLFPNWAMQCIDTTDALDQNVLHFDRTSPLFVQALIEYLITVNKPMKSLR